MQVAGQSSLEGFFLSLCVSRFLWLLGTRSTSKVGSGFFFFLLRSLLDRWMDAFLAATLPAFVQNSMVRSCALLLSPPSSTFSLFPLLPSLVYIYNAVPRLSSLFSLFLLLPLSPSPARSLVHRHIHPSYLLILLHPYPCAVARLSFVQSRAISLSAAIVHTSWRHLRLA